MEIREELVGGDSLSNRLGSEGLYPMSSLTFLNTRLSPPHPPVSPHPVGYPSCLALVLTRIGKVESLNCTWALSYGKSQKVGTSLCGPSDPLGCPCLLLWARNSWLLFLFNDKCARHRSLPRTWLVYLVNGLMRAIGLHL